MNLKAWSGFTEFLKIQRLARFQILAEVFKF